MNKLALLISCAVSLFGQSQQPLTNDDVIRMVQQGISSATIIESVKTARAVVFKITPEDQPALVAASVPRPVIVAMIERVMRDESRSNYDMPKESSATNRASNGTTQQGTDPWSLRPGKSEMMMRIGGGTFRNQLYGRTYEWYAGGGLGFGVTRYLAGIGEYSYSQLTGDSFLGLVQGRIKMQDALFGARLSMPGLRGTGYVFAGGGFARYDTEVSSLGRITQTNPAIGLGGGLSFAITPAAGVQWEIRFVKPADFIWRTRSSGGLYFRF
jgi:hypothetical protein